MQQHENECSEKIKLNAWMKMNAQSKNEGMNKIHIRMAIHSRNKVTTYQ